MLAVVTHPEPRTIEARGWAWIATLTVAAILFAFAGFIGGAEFSGLGDINFAP